MYKAGIPLVVCDIETAGLAVTHDIIQIAAVVVSTKDWSEKESFEVKLKFDEAKAEATALKVNGYTAEAWKDAVTPLVGLTRLSRLFERHRSATRTSKAGRPYTVAIGGGYNAAFDSERIMFQSRKLNIFQAVDPRFLDVMQLAFWKQLGLESYKLTSVAEHFKLSTEGAHDALADVRITVEVLKRLLA